MFAHGRVQNGVVALDDCVRLPEGQEVTVLAHGTVPTAPRMEGSPSHSVLDVATVTLGSVLRPLTSDDDLLGEMLAEKRRRLCCIEIIAIIADTMSYHAIIAPFD
jgi:hypothetical protein